MAAYQEQRGAEYAGAVRDGTAETFWSALRAEPGRVALTVLGSLHARPGGAAVHPLARVMQNGELFRAMGGAPLTECPQRVASGD